MKIFGLDIEVPEDAGFVSRDSDGTLTYHTEAPDLEGARVYTSNTEELVYGIETQCWNAGEGFISIDSNGSYHTHSTEPSLDEDGWWSNRKGIEVFEPSLVGLFFGYWIGVPLGTVSVCRDADGTIWLYSDDKDPMMAYGVEPGCWSFDGGFISLDANGSYLSHDSEPTLGENGWWEGDGEYVKVFDYPLQVKL